MVPINTITGGESVERAIMYRPPSRQLYDYLQNNYHNAVNYIKDIGGTFVDNVKSLYNKYTSDEAIYNAKQTLANVGLHFSQDAIYDIEYGKLNQANLIMQRYMMAHPKVGDQYSRGMLYGFQNTFFDREPDAVGDERLDYYRAMDGVLQFDAEGNGYVEYMLYDDSVLGELDLTDDEQMSLARMYDLVTDALLAGVDPTDPENSMDA